MPSRLALKVAFIGFVPFVHVPLALTIVLPCFLGFAFTGLRLVLLLKASAGPASITFENRDANSTRHAV